MRHATYVVYVGGSESLLSQMFQGRFDHLLIESTGISEPMPVAETFTFESEQGHSLCLVAELDTRVTVVDAGHFMKDFGSWDDLSDRRMGLNEDDKRNIVDLLVDQVEFANVCHCQQD